MNQRSMGEQIIKHKLAQTGQRLSWRPDKFNPLIDDKQVIVAVETKDNQLSFNSLQILNKPSINSDEKLQFQFSEEKEFLPRQRDGVWTSDPIVGFKYILNR
mmetsp:Transcript_33875/g.24916  ORF Transcript_33875/g.24916 Transcript_33875/m.24916 type:complete len:102 (+) Transcript_33875:618-923(+)